MNATSGLSASLEDYLEAIYYILLEKNAVRAKDIAARLKVSNASVTGALRVLGKRNYLNYTPYDVITFTPKGEKVAKKIALRHEVLRDFLVRVLAVKYEEADEAACRLEHGMSEGIADRLVSFIEFIDSCPLGGSKLTEGFRRHLECGMDKEQCDRCLELARSDLADAEEEVSTIENKVVPLSSVEPGKRATVKKIMAKGTLRKRLMEMGFTPGSVVDVERVAPAGDPVELRVRGYFVSLRKEDLSHIEVE